MKFSGIYKIQSIKKPERCYIGSAVNINRRWRQHLQELHKNKHHTSKLQRHFNKYGAVDLQFSILLGCEKENLIANEQFFLDSYYPYFNTCKIAGSTIGCKASDETKNKISKSLIGNQRSKGYIQSEESNKKRSEALSGDKSPHFGKKFSIEHCSNMSEANKGHIAWNKGTKGVMKAWNKNKKGLQVAWNKGVVGAFSDEALKNMSLAQIGNKNRIGKKHSEESKRKNSESLKASWAARKLKNIG